MRAGEIVVINNIRSQRWSRPNSPGVLLGKLRVNMMTVVCMISSRIRQQIADFDGVSRSEGSTSHRVA